MEKGTRTARRGLLTALALALLSLTAAALIAHALLIRVDGILCRRDAEALELRGAALSAEDYDALSAELPDCRIRWTVPLSGGGWDSAAETVRVQSLTDGDTELFKYFKSLRRVLADGCTEAGPLLKLRAARPEVEIFAALPVGGAVAAVPADKLSFAGDASLDAEALAALAPLLPDLTRLDLTGCGLTEADVELLSAAYPRAFLKYGVTLYGREFSTDAEEIDLSGTAVGDVAELEAALPLFPLLKKVVMCDCGVSSEDMAALNDRHNGVRFVWRIYFSAYSLRTDDTSFCSGRFQSSPALDDRSAAPLKYCTDMEALDLGHMSVSDLSFLQYMPKLKYLILADGSTSDLTYIGQCCPELVYLELFMCPIYDVSPLVSCKKLTDLNLCYTYLRDISPLMEMTQLQYLWYGGNSISYSGQKALTEALPNTEIYFIREQSTGGGWRYHEHYYDMRDAMGMYYMPYGNTRPET